MRESFLVVAIGLAITSCTASDPYARVNPAVYLCHSSDSVDDADICPKFGNAGAGLQTPLNEIAEPECVFWQKSGPMDRFFSSVSFGDGSSKLNMCFYQRAYVNQTAVDDMDKNAFEAVPTPQSSPAVEPPAAAAAPIPAPAPEQSDFQLKPDFERRRNEIVDYLLNISDFNCNNFLDRLFAKQTGVSFAKGLVNVVTSASAALTGFASVPAAAGLNAGNASLGGGLDAINTDVYYSRTAPDIAQAIRNKRAQLRQAIILRELGTTPAAIGAKAAEGAKTKSEQTGQQCDKDKAKTKHDHDLALKADKKAIKSLPGDVDTQIKDCQAAADAAEIAKDAQDAATKSAAASAQANLPQTPYTLSAATADVINYDSQCSMLGGLTNLTQAVASTNPTPTKSNSNPSASPTPAPKKK